MTLLLVSELQLGGRERGFLTYQNGNNSGYPCFYPAVMGMVMVPSCCLAFQFVYMSVVTIKVKRKKDV